MDTPSFKSKSGIAVYTTGEGEPLIVVGGGPGISSRAYRACLTKLAETHQVYFWDFAGLSPSESRAEYSFKGDYQDLAALVAQIGKPVHLLGHSYGGLLVIQYAAQHPDEVLSLILISASTAFAPVLAGAMERHQQKLSTVDFQKMVRLMLKFQSQSFTPEDVEDYMEIEWRCHFRDELSKEEKERARKDFNLQVHNQNQDWLSIDLTPLLPSIKAKAWIVTSQNDIIVPPEFSQVLSKIPNASKTEFKNSYHWPFYDEADLFFQEFESFRKS